MTTTDRDAVAKLRNRELWFSLLLFAAGLVDGLLLGWWLW